MTQLLEAVAVDPMIAGGRSTRCPFDCGSKCNATNVLVRNGNPQENKESGVPTVRFKVVGPKQFESTTENVDSQKENPPEEDDEFENYFGWASHHLIPVSSLEKDAICVFLDSSIDGAQVSCNVGYDVNGANNLKWLIGSSELRLAIENDSWVSKTIRESMERSGVQFKGTVYQSLSRDARKIRENPQIDDRLHFRKTLYQTMLKYRMQFHDAHHSKGGYNEFVSLILSKVRVNLVEFRDSCWGTGQCADDKSGAMPGAPHRIARRFDFISSRLDRLLSGHPSTWRNPVFTSGFCRMLAVTAQNEPESLPTIG